MIIKARTLAVHLVGHKLILSMIRTVVKLVKLTVVINAKVILILHVGYASQVIIELPATSARNVWITANLANNPGGLGIAYFVLNVTLATSTVVLMVFV